MGRPFFKSYPPKHFSQGLDMATQPTLANWLSVLALGLIWGGTFMVVSIALQGYGPLTVASARTTLGALALLSLMRAMNRPMPVFDARMIKYLVVIGAAEHGAALCTC